MGKESGKGGGLGRKSFRPPCSPAVQPHSWGDPTKGGMLRCTASHRNGGVLVSPPCSVTDQEKPGEAEPQQEFQRGPEGTAPGGSQAVCSPSGYLERRSEQCASIANTIPIQPAFMEFSVCQALCVLDERATAPGL